jgi:hypothetical protein
MPEQVSVTSVKPPLQAVIDENTLGQKEIVAAVTGTKIVVVHWNLMSAGTQNAKWQSASTDITGTYPLVANVGVAPPQHVEGYALRTSAGEALNLNLSANVQVGGYILYHLE